MDQEVLEIIKVCAEALLVPIAGAIATLIVQLVKVYSTRMQAQTKNEELNDYIRIAEKTITDVVMATNQTFVDIQKAQGTFDKEAWAIAFTKTQQNILAVLTEAEKEALAEAYGDLNRWLEIKIEAEVKKQKEAQVLLTA